LAADEQVWPAIPPATYTVLIDSANGWIIHPDDVLAGLDQLVAVAGSTVETTLRVFRPATFELTVLDSVSHAPVTDASLTLTNLDLLTATAYAPGEYTINNLMPETYGVLVTAPGYIDWELVSLNIPAAYPDPLHQLTVYIEALAPPTTTTTTTDGSGSSSSTSSTTSTTLPGSRIPIEFVVVNNRDRVVAGASVNVTHGSDGPFSGITDKYGKIVFNLLDGESYTAVGSTSWGHGPDSDPVNVGGWIDALELSRPSGKGLMTLSGGGDAEFLYRSNSSNPWTVMPANYQNEASFASNSGWHEVAKRCIANGEVKGAKDVYVRSGRNRSATIYGWCPSS
jgi:hypothetical protein